ncbi:unnamed protein product, partial [marine sediment metagenome]
MNPKNYKNESTRKITNKKETKNGTKKEDIEISNSKIVKNDEMKKYEKETGKYSVWRGVVTEGFKKWKEGGKIYDRDKERISLYISEDAKKEWQKFIKKYNYSTISKLIRESVNYFIEKKTSLSNNDLSRMDLQSISNISHALKEPLTTIKGFSQLLIENYKEELSEEVLSTIKNIFNQSILLEKKIINVLDNIKVEASQYDILLIEDDLPTIRLITSYFESKGYICKGVVSGKKGLDELKSGTPKIILLDIILPDYSGYDICKIVKSDEKYKD